METADIRRRLVRRLEELRQASARRRAAIDRARAQFPSFLEEVAVPVFTRFGQALRAEGHVFRLDTPADGVRLTSERSSETFVELELDVELDPPSAVGRVSRTRGRHVTTHERPVRPDATLLDLTQEDVLEFLLDEVAPLIQR